MSADDYLWPMPMDEIAARAVWAVVDGEEIGICLNCGLKAKVPVPVDAHGLRCETCDEDCVAAAEEIVLRAMGWKRGTSLKHWKRRA